MDPSLNDPIASITRHDLDEISKTRPIFLLHASCHVASVNSATLEVANYAAIKAPGVLRDASGAPTGELREMAAMMSAVKAVASDMIGGSTDAAQFYNFARVAQARGVTTIVDGGGSTYFNPAFLAAALSATSAADFPARIVAHNNGITVASAQDMIKFATALEGKGNDKLVFQGIQLILDAGLSRHRRKWVVEPGTGGAARAGACPAQCGAADRGTLQCRPGRRNVHRGGGAGAGAEAAL